MKRVEWICVWLFHFMFVLGNFGTMLLSSQGHCGNRAWEAQGNHVSKTVNLKSPELQPHKCADDLTKFLTKRNNSF